MCYNARQYCDSYHLLENVARWEKPEVFGVAKKMDRSGMKSKYCTIGATKAFETLINDIKARYILLSYNNMAEKGNCRSNAKISDFRSRKTTPFYDPQDYSKSVNGMKIIPLQTSELKKIVSNSKTYKELYPIFEEAFNSTLPPHEWYNTNICEIF